MKLIFAVNGINIRDVFDIDYENATVSPRHDRLEVLRELFGEPVLVVDDDGVTRIPSEEDLMALAAEYSERLRTTNVQNNSDPS